MRGILPEFDFSSLRHASITIIGNSAEKISAPVLGSHVIRFNDWSSRPSVDKSVAADTVFSNGDSHNHTYGRGIRWPSRVVFVRNAGGLAKTIPKHYPEFGSLFLMKSIDHDKAQKHIKHNWATVGYIVAYNIVNTYTGSIYLSGFTWERGKDRFYNHHDWEAERSWFRDNASRFVLSPETKNALM